MEDSRKRIWVGTNDGILVFRDASHLEDYSHYGTKEGLQNTNVRAIQEDHDGTIWLSTNAGISRLDEKTKTFYNYNHYDGVPMGDFMDGSTCIFYLRQTDRKQRYRASPSSHRCQHTAPL